MDEQPTEKKSSASINEDWLSVLLAFLLLLLSVLGVIGEAGIRVRF